MEIGQDIQLNLINEKSQNEFLNSTLWKTINNGIDIGIRYLLPDLIEEEIIELKDNLINFGLKDGIKKSIDSVIETGKEAIGIFTGNFENVTQIQKVVKNGGIIDKVSDVLDVVIEKGEEKGKINNTIGKALKKGKASILSSVERNIEATLNNQINSAKNVEKYINNWKEYYNKEDFEGMTKEYNKIKTQLNKVVPLENILKETRKVETLHELIKNNGQNFNITELEKNAIENLAQ